MTDQYTPEPRRPGRPTNAEREARANPRAEEVKQRRRRRDTLGEDRNLKLYVPESAKDPNFVYRWVNKRDGRVKYMTEQDDYDVVSTTQLNGGDDKNISEGTVATRVGDQTTGEGMVLLRKPREFFEEDQKAKADKLDELDKTMRIGPAQSAEGIGPSDHAYVPGGRNRIGR